MGYSVRGRAQCQALLELSGKSAEELGQLTGLGSSIYAACIRGVVDLMDDEIEMVASYTRTHYPVRPLWSRQRDPRDDLIER